MKIVPYVMLTVGSAWLACGTSPAQPIAAADGGGSASCDAGTVLALTSASLGMPSLRLVEQTALRGDGVAPTLMTQQNVTAGLRWQGDRMFLLTDSGFWDIPTSGDARWYPTSARLLWGVRAGDLDGDGDLDLILLSMELNPSAAVSGANPVESRLAAWERTPDGLVERGEVLRNAGMGLPMPYVLADVDGDGDLDIVSWEHGTPVAYINAGNFTFARLALGDTTAAYADSGAFVLDYADRDHDGANDLLVVAGSFTSDQLENKIFVQRGLGDGQLGPPEPAIIGKSPLVQHGPDGIGIGIADVTGDGLADVIMQDPASVDTPILRLHISTSASSVAPAIELAGLGFAFADVDADGATDIVTTRDSRLVALLSRGAGAFDVRELGVDMARPPLRGFVVEPGIHAAPAVLHALYELTACTSCAGCAGRCIASACVSCLSDVDCRGGTCAANSCEH